MPVAPGRILPYKELMTNHDFPYVLPPLFRRSQDSSEEIKNMHLLRHVGMSHQLTARKREIMLDGVIESHTAAMLEFTVIYA